MSQRLPRFASAIEKFHDSHRLAEILLDVEAAHPEIDDDEELQRAGSTAPGDTTRLRGIAALARGARGAVRGSVPHVDGLGD